MCEHGKTGRCQGLVTRHVHVSYNGAFSVDLCAFHLTIWQEVERSIVDHQSHHPIEEVVETEDERMVRVASQVKRNHPQGPPKKLRGFVSGCGRRIFTHSWQSSRFAGSDITPSCPECAVARDKSLEAGTSLVSAQVAPDLTEEQITLRIWRHVEPLLQAARVVVAPTASSEAVEVAGNILNRGVLELISAGEIPVCRIVDVWQRPLQSGNAFIAFDIARYP